MSPSLSSATKSWFAISLQTFGGPAGQIAVMQDELVEKKKWLDQDQFNHALSFCMLLPGPEAQQLAVYTGWLLNGIRGGLIAGSLFILPGFVALLALSVLYVLAGDTKIVELLFSGIAPAVIAIVVSAVIRVAKKSLKTSWQFWVAGLSFLALTVFRVPFPVVIFTAMLVGWLLNRRQASPTQTSAQVVTAPAHKTWQVLAIGLTLWVVPVIVLILLFPNTQVFQQQAWFFSSAAVVTFGGAYAVLAYVAQQAVHTFGWLAPGEMLRGLALAESTPGPLIMVVQFVAFLGGFRHPGDLNPWVAGVIASVLTVWVTFVPSFLFVLVGAPFMERIRHHAGLSAALAGVTAAVVGVIANLAVYFTLHTWFGSTQPGPFNLELPVWSTMHYFQLGLTGLALLMIFKFNWTPLRTLLICALLGLTQLVF